LPLLSTMRPTSITVAAERVASRATDRVAGDGPAWCAPRAQISEVFGGQGGGHRLDQFAVDEDVDGEFVDPVVARVAPPGLGPKVIRRAAGMSAKRSLTGMTLSSIPVSSLHSRPSARNAPPARSNCHECSGARAARDATRDCPSSMVTRPTPRAPPDIPALPTTLGHRTRHWRSPRRARFTLFADVTSSEFLVRSVTHLVGLRMTFEEVVGGSPKSGHCQNLLAAAESAVHKIPWT
jgi:hypothetical protein